MKANIRKRQQLNQPRVTGHSPDAKELSESSAAGDTKAHLATIVGSVMREFRRPPGPARARWAMQDIIDACELLAWLKTRCRLTGQHSDFEWAHPLYESYWDWKRCRGEPPLPPNVWNALMQKLGANVFYIDGATFRGVRFRPDERARLESVTPDPARAV